MNTKCTILKFSISAIYYFSKIESFWSVYKVFFADTKNMRQWYTSSFNQPCFMYTFTDIMNTYGLLKIGSNKGRSLRWLNERKIVFHSHFGQFWQAFGTFFADNFPQHNWNHDILCMYHHSQMNSQHIICAISYCCYNLKSNDIWNYDFVLELFYVRYDIQVITKKYYFS